MVFKKKNQQIDLVRRIKQSKINVFSATSGLKGYKVGSKKFTPTKTGEKKAEVAASKLFKRTGKARVEYLY